MFSACHHFNGKLLNTIFGVAVGSDMIRFAFCKDRLQNCELDCTAVGMEDHLESGQVSK